MIDPSLNESHGFSPSFRISLFYRGEKKKQQLVFFFSFMHRLLFVFIQNIINALGFYV